MSILLSILKRFWKELLIVALSGAFLVSMRSCQKQAKEKRIARENTQELAMENSVMTRELNLTSREMDKMLAAKNDEIAWLLDSLDKKPKKVVEIQVVRTESLVHDTIPIVRTINMSDTTFSTTYESCGVDAKFEWENGADSGAWTVKDKTSIGIAVVWERKPLFGFKLLPKWGKKEFNGYALNQCGDSIVTNLKIKRR
jgi:hypothetical protein